MADAALHLRRVELGRLQAALDHCSRWPGLPWAAATVALADGRSESPLESLSRVRLRQAELPSAQLQGNVHDLNGVWLARVDFLWDEYGVVGEADGALKYDGTDHRILLEEKRRQERIEQTGLIVVRWDHSDLHRMTQLADRLRRAFVRGSRRPAEERRWLLPAEHAA